VPNLPIPALCPHDNYFSDGLRIGDEAKVAARTARMASTDTTTAVPSAIANVAAPPTQNIPCASANTWPRHMEVTAAAGITVPRGRADRDGHDGGGRAVSEEPALERLAATS